MELVNSTAASTIPTLGNAAVSPAFSMFRAEEGFSFVRPYDAKTVSVPGYLHQVIRYRNVDKPGTVVKAAQMVTVPVMVFREDLAIVLTEKESAVFKAVLEDAQNDMIRGFIELGQTKINWADISWEKILEFKTAERVSQRLTKEQVTAWAQVAMKAFCEQRAAQICEAKGINDAAEIAKQKAGTLNAYVELLAKLAAPIPNLGQNQATALSNALVVAKLDDDMAKVLKNKLYAILHPEITENGDL